MTLMRRMTVGAAGCLLIASSFFGAAARATVTATDCVIPYEPPASVPRIEATPNGVYTFQTWLASDASQTAVNNLGVYLEKTYGYGATGDATDSLAQGLIGVAIDHVDQQYVVVVDPSTSDSDQESLQTTLQGIAASAASSVDADAKPLAVRVAAGCNSANELAKAEGVVSARDWKAGASKIAMASYVDAHDSTLHVMFNKDDADIANALAGQLGSLVTIERGSPTTSSRTADSAPHRSAAGIRAASADTNHCTSMVTVNLPGGGLGSVTAAHCFTQTGDHTINGRGVRSSDQYYGVTAGASGFSSGYDMVRITSTDSFQTEIWTDPPSGDTRTTFNGGGGDPQQGAYVCTDGAVTRAVCGVEVTAVDVTNFCPAPDGYCRQGAFRMHKDNAVINTGGDSGGPVYVQLSGDQAGIRGIILGQNCSGNPCDTAWGTKWSVVRDHLNVTIAG